MIAELKIERLRPVEQLIYQVAHYLLGDNDAAAAASEEALIELFQTPQFFSGTEEEQLQLARSTAARHALKSAALQADSAARG